MDSIIKVVLFLLIYWVDYLMSNPNHGFILRPLRMLLSFIIVIGVYMSLDLGYDWLKKRLGKEVD